VGWLPQLVSRTLDIIFVRMIDNSNKYLLNQIMRASTPKIMKFCTCVLTRFMYRALSHSQTVWIDIAWVLVGTLPSEFLVLLLVTRLYVDSPPSSSPRSNSEVNWDPRHYCSVNSVAHASELIWNQSYQILVVCVQRRCGILRQHHRTETWRALIRIFCCCWP